MKRDGVLQVLQPGLLSALQDGGRKGASHLGIAPCGYADPYAANWANRLVENPQGTALIEVLVGGFSGVFTASTSIAVCGAVGELRINDRVMSGWQSHRVVAGDRIELGHANNGLRAYLALAGGLVARSSFGSCATNTREKLGGLLGDGEPLKVGDQLVSSTVVQPFKQAKAPRRAIPQYPDAFTLRFVPGYQYAAFSSVEVARLASVDFSVSERMDRMGIQLIGNQILPPKLSMLSEGISYGAIQVPPDGNPIVMLSDRQTIGGYPKLGSLLSIDAAKLAQAKSGSRVSLQEISLEQAHNLISLEQAKNKQLMPICY